MKGGPYFDALLNQPLGHFLLLACGLQSCCMEMDSLGITKYFFSPEATCHNSFCEIKKNTHTLLHNCYILQPKEEYWLYVCASCLWYTRINIQVQSNTQPAITQAGENYFDSCLGQLSIICYERAPIFMKWRLCVCDVWWSGMIFCHNWNCSAGKKELWCLQQADI